jgi:hypothetical protein
VILVTPAMTLETGSLMVINFVKTCRQICKAKSLIEFLTMMSRKISSTVFVPEWYKQTPEWYKQTPQIDVFPHLLDTMICNAKKWVELSYSRAVLPISFHSLILNFSKSKQDVIEHSEGNSAELDDTKIRRAIIFCKEGEWRILKLKSALETCGFIVHLIDLQYLLLTLQKSNKLILNLKALF